MLLAARRFDDLPTVTLWIDLRGKPNELPPPMRGVIVKLPMWVLEVDEAQRVLDEIERARQEDPPPREFPENLEENARAAARETARVGAYLVFACALDKVVRRVAAQLAQLTKPYDEAVSKACSDGVNGGDTGFALVRKYRNKIFAHPAGADPRQEDSSSLRATSTFVFSGQGAAWAGGEIFLGAARLHAMGEDAPDLNKLPPISFRMVREATRKQMHAWWEILQRAMCVLQDVDEEDLKRTFLGAARRHPPETLRRMAEQHLFYEIQMLLVSIEFDPRAFSADDWRFEWARNARVEAFAIHLRALVEFLWERATHDKDVRASDYMIDASWKPSGPYPSELKERANKEIVHLTTGRLDVLPDAKPWDFRRDAAPVVAAIREFLQAADSDTLGTLEAKLRGCGELFAILLEAPSDG